MGDSVKVGASVGTVHRTSSQQPLHEQQQRFAAQPQSAAGEQQQQQQQAQVPAKGESVFTLVASHI